MKLKRLNIIILMISILILESCGKESSCLKSSGDILKEVRSVGVITKIKMNDNINLILTQSVETTLTVEASENLMPYIKTILNSGTLELINDNKCDFLRNYKKPINVYLSVPNLTEIDYNGKGNITNIGILNFPFLKIDNKNGTGNVNINVQSEEVRLYSHSGAASFTLSGTTNKLFVFSGSSTGCYFSSLTANSVHVKNAGVGDVSVNANNSLLVELTSLGSIIYSGNPVVTISVHTGSGQLIKQ